MRFESLQIGRGLAALLVVLVHATTFARLNYHEVFAHNVFLRGSAGVDFFFVLSGFIIFFRHARDIGRPDRFAEYAWRRLIRIFPIYWIVTLAILPTYFFVPSYGQGDETSPYIVTTSLLLMPAYRSPILVAAWTLIQEVWFYILFGCWIAFRGQYIRWALGTWALCIGGLVVSDRNPHGINNHPWLEVIFSPVNFEFILGCAAAWLLSKFRLVPALSAGLLVIGIATFVAFSFELTHQLPFIPARRELTFGLSAFLMVLGAASWESIGERPKSFWTFWLWGSLIFLGDASYSLYLLHGPALSATCKFGTAMGLTDLFGANAVSWIAVGACIVSGGLLHRFVERPLLQRLRVGSERK